MQVGLRKTLYDLWGLSGTKTGFLVQAGKDPSRYPPTALWATGMSAAMQTSLKIRLKYYLAISWLFRDNDLCC